MIFSKLFANDYSYKTLYEAELVSGYKGTNEALKKGFETPPNQIKRKKLRDRRKKK